MSKIKDFFNFLYKKIYGSELEYLIVTTIYFILCLSLAIYSMPENVSFLLSVFYIIINTAFAAILLFPFLIIIGWIYNAIDSLIFEIKFKVEGIKISKKKSNKFKKNR